ncbi:MAG: hypothetical protein ACE5G2_01830 [Candidatus Krumholzibacteriia bacterium]
MKKVLVGCAVAAGVLLLLGVVSGVLVVNWVRKELPEMKRLTEAREALIERFGDREDYVPALDAQLRPERIELFVSAREHLLFDRAEVAARLESFIKKTRSEDWERRGAFEKLVEGLNMLKGGLGIAGQGMEYLGIRSEKLLDAGMGEGEYAYLFCLMCYSWLEWDPFEALGEEAVEDLGLEDEVVALQGEFRRILLRQLKNQRLELQDKDDRTPAEERALELVADAIRQARDRSGRFPFQGAIPSSWVAVLEPFRDRFTATLPTTPTELLLESVEQLLEEDDSSFTF